VCVARCAAGALQIGSARGVGCTGALTLPWQLRKDDQAPKMTRGQPDIQICGRTSELDCPAAPAPRSSTPSVRHRHIDAASSNLAHAAAARRRYWLASDSLWRRRWEPAAVSILTALKVWPAAACVVRRCCSRLCKVSRHLPRLPRLHGRRCEHTAAAPPPPAGCPTCCPTCGPGTQ